MSAQHSSRDGLSQLTELMRQERVVEPSAGRTIDPAIRRRRRRTRRIVGGLAALVVAALVAGYLAVALGSPIGAASVHAEAPVVAASPAAQLVLSPDAAVAVTVTGGEEYLGPGASGIWAAGGGDDPRPIASITKLITALVVLDRKPLAGAGDPGPTLTFDRDDHALYDKYYVLNATIAAMPTGSSMSQHDALEAMLVVSACNYAEAVANWAFGSQGAFLQATRDWLAANGLTRTTVVEPTGLDPGNTSTPSDLIALGRIAMADPVIAGIVGMSRLEVPNIPVTPSTNDLLGTDGVTGLKTGTLDATGSNLLFASTLDVGIGAPLQVIGVLLGGYTHESVNADARALLASIRAGFHTVLVGERGQEVGTYSTAWGDSASIVLAESASVLTWSDTAVTAELRVDQSLEVGSDGDVVGEIVWTAGPNTISAPLVLEGGIEPPSTSWRLSHPFDLIG